jgi:hypothetical protein
METPAHRSPVFYLSEAERRLTPDGPALVGPDGTRHDVPERVFDALQKVESVLRSGMGVMITPLRPELPVDEAAEAIEMDFDEFRSYVADGEIPFRSSEHVDWVKLVDVLDFDRRLALKRQAALQVLRDEEPWDTPTNGTG